eukprot:7911983-Pyramimonas_sp.AAC.1
MGHSGATCEVTCEATLKPLVERRRRAWVSVGLLVRSQVRPHWGLLSDGGAGRGSQRGHL